MTAPVNPRLCTAEVEALDHAEHLIDQVLCHVGAPTMREALGKAAELVRIVAHGPDPAPEDVDDVETLAESGIPP